MTTRITCKLEAPDGLVCRYMEPWSDKVGVSVWLTLPSPKAAQEFVKRLTPGCDLVLEIPDEAHRDALTWIQQNVSHTHAQAFARDMGLQWDLKHSGDKKP